MFYYGEIVLFGFGAAADPILGAKLLESSELEEAELLLESYHNRFRG